MLRYDDEEFEEDDENNEKGKVNTKSLSPYRNPTLIKPIKSKQEL